MENWNILNQHEQQHLQTMFKNGNENITTLAGLMNATSCKSEIPMIIIIKKIYSKFWY